MPLAAAGQTLERGGQTPCVGPVNLGVACAGRQLGGHANQLFGGAVRRESARQQLGFPHEVRPHVLGARCK